MEDKIIKLRESLDKINFFERKDILKFPDFYEFVDCKYIDDKNFQMFLGGHDDLVAARFYWNGCYERKTLGLWSRFCKKYKSRFYYRYWSAHRILYFNLYEYEQK